MIDFEKMILKRQRLNLESYRNKILSLLERYPYGWWVNLSFRYEPKSNTDAANMAKGWLIHLAKKYDLHFWPFMALEPRWSKDRAHVHIVLIANHYLQIRKLKSAWKHGNTVIQLLDMSKGASEYNFKDHIAEPSFAICSGKSGCRRNRKGRVFCSVDPNRELIY